VSSCTLLDGPTDTLLVRRIAIVPPELVTSTGSIHENVQSILVKRIAPHTIVSSNRRTPYCETCERERLSVARVVCHNNTSGPWVISLPALHMIVLNSGAYRAVENDAARTKRSTFRLRAEQLVVAESHVFDTRVEKCSVARIADVVVFDLCAVSLDAVAS
jgi:hypothetical protein